MKRHPDFIAKEYFDYLGKHLPQHSASDEFYFLPRSEMAVQYLSVLDVLKPEKIQDHVRYIRDLLAEISLKQATDLEGSIDLLILKQSMESFLREFDDAKIWQNDPTLYVKIPLFATDRIISRRHGVTDQIKHDLITLFAQIPLFLRLASKTLRSPSEVFLRVAISMARDAISFYSREVMSFIEERMDKNGKLIKNTKEVCEALEEYQLCYFMGTYEILRLRDRFLSQSGPKPFHDTLLAGGEIPFHLVEKRLEARFTKKEGTRQEACQKKRRASSTKKSGAETK